MTILFQDNFDGDTSGSIAPGWANVVGTFAVGTLNPVSGAKSFGSTSAAAHDVALYTALGTRANMGVSFDQIITNVTSSNGYAAVLRSNSAQDTCYILTFGITATQFSLIVYSKIAGTFAQIGSTYVLNGTYAVNDVLHLRASIVGSTISFFLSTNGAALPTSANATFTDGNITAAGYPGVFLISNGTVSFDNFTYDDGSTASALTAGAATQNSVGSTTASLTIGAATGGTSPYTQQWYRATTTGFTPGSGNLISGATGLTLNDTGLTPSTAYFYKCVQTDSASATATSNQVAVTTSAAGSASITITSPTAYQVFQRSGTTGGIAIAGSHTDSVARNIEASFNGGAFATIATSVAPGAFTGTLAAQAQGSGTLTVRLVGNTGVLTTVSSVGIGDVYAILGQSNGVGQGTNPQVFHNAVVPGAMFTASYQWAPLADPGLGATNNQTDSSLPSNGNVVTGSVWPLFAARLASAIKVPVAIVQCCRSGCGLSYTTNVQTWLPLPSNHLDRTTLYGSANFRSYTVGGVKAVLWWGGESDAINGRTQAQYQADYTTFTNAISADLNAPTMPCLLNTMTGVSPGNQAAINAATAALWGTLNVKIGPDFRDMTSVDAYHLMTDDQLSTAADRWVSAVSNAFYPVYTGSGTFPTAAQVLNGVTFGPTANLTGNVSLPTAGQVQSGVTFGSAGSLTGTLASGGFVQPTTTRAVSVTVTNPLGLPLANQSFKWTWFDQSLPQILGYPCDQGANVSTNAQGILSMTVHSALASGGVGTLVLSSTDGTTTQNPAALEFVGPVAVT